MLGSDTISAETFQRHHPWIEDPHAEQTRITDEKLEKGAVSGLLQQVVSGQMPMAVFARIRQKMMDGTKDIFQATVEVDEEVRAEQAEAQQAAMEQQAAQQAQMSPQAQLGLAAGPQAAAPGAIPPEMMAALQQRQQQQPALPQDRMRQMLQQAVGGSQ